MSPEQPPWRWSEVVPERAHLPSKRRRVRVFPDAESVCCPACLAAGREGSPVIKAASGFPVGKGAYTGTCGRCKAHFFFDLEAVDPALEAS